MRLFRSAPTRQVGVAGTLLLLLTSVCTVVVSLRTDQDATVRPLAGAAPLTVLPVASPNNRKLKESGNLLNLMDRVWFETGTKALHSSVSAAKCKKPKSSKGSDKGSSSTPTTASPSVSKTAAPAPIATISKSSKSGNDSNDLPLCADAETYEPSASPVGTGVDATTNPTQNGGGTNSTENPEQPSVSPSTVQPGGESGLEQPSASPSVAQSGGESGLGQPSVSPSVAQSEGDSGLGQPSASPSEQGSALPSEQPSANESAEPSVGGSTEDNTPEDGLVEGEFDCAAVADGTASTDGNTQSYTVNFILVVDGSVPSQDVVTAVAEKLQQVVAPALLGCTRRRRFLQTSSLTNFVFGKPETQAQGICSFQPDGTCVLISMETTLYYTGEEPVRFEPRLESAIEAAFDNGAFDDIAGLTGSQFTVPSPEGELGTAIDPPTSAPFADEVPTIFIGTQPELKSANDGLRAPAVVGASVAGLLLLLGAIFYESRRRGKAKDDRYHHKPVPAVVSVHHRQYNDDDDDMEQSSCPQNEKRKSRQVRAVGQGNSVVTSRTGDTILEEQEIFLCPNGEDTDFLFEETNHSCSSPHCLTCELKRRQGIMFVKATLPEGGSLPPRSARDRKSVV